MTLEKYHKLKELLEGESLEEVIGVAKEVCDGSFHYDSKEEILESLKTVLRRAFEANREEGENCAKTAERAFPEFDELKKLWDQYYPGWEYRALDEFDNDMLLERIECTHELSIHDEQVRQDYYDNDLREMIKMIWEEKTNLSLWLTDWTPDELWQRFADAFCCGYYDKERFLKGFEEFKKKLFSSTYWQMIMREEK